MVELEDEVGEGEEEVFVCVEVLQTVDLTSSLMVRIATSDGDAIGMHHFQIFMHLISLVPSLSPHMWGPKVIHENCACIGGRAWDQG